MLLLTYPQTKLNYTDINNSISKRKGSNFPLSQPLPNKSHTRVTESREEKKTDIQILKRQTGF